MSDQFRLERVAHHGPVLTPRQAEGEFISEGGAMRAFLDRRCFYISPPDESGRVVYRYTFPTISHDLAVQVRYESMRLKGESHNFAEMMATRSFPGINGTGKAWNKGRGIDGRGLQHRMSPGGPTASLFEAAQGR